MHMQGVEAPRGSCLSERDFFWSQAVAAVPRNLRMARPAGSRQGLSQELFRMVRLAAPVAVAVMSAERRDS